MITLIVAISVLWIFLKLLTTMIELPFKILGALLRAPLSVFFWLAIFMLFFYAII
ncbi:MAG: hypothetical protein K5637_05760 [Lachnospiraceae bacterium]|nr:hypothetical protein [Lachnospiraceae bacterium]